MGECIDISKLHLPYYTLSVEVLGWIVILHLKTSLWHLKHIIKDLEPVFKHQIQFSAFSRIYPFTWFNSNWIHTFDIQILEILKLFSNERIQVYRMLAIKLTRTNVSQIHFEQIPTSLKVYIELITQELSPTKDSITSWNPVQFKNQGKY